MLMTTPVKDLVLNHSDKRFPEEVKILVEEGTVLCSDRIDHSTSLFKSTALHAYPRCYSFLGVLPKYDSEGKEIEYVFQFFYSEQPDNLAQAIGHMQYNIVKGDISFLGNLDLTLIRS
jgi:hypothetical protein